MPTIIGAGITEQWYFTHLKALRGYRMKVRPRFFGTETADGMAKKIREVLADGGFAICVFDADVSSWNEQERRKLDALHGKYRDNRNVLLCDSMPAIEYWFLLHYRETNKHFGTSRAVIQELKAFIPQYDKTAQFLQNGRWVAQLSSDGRLEQARHRAKAFGTEGESYTNIDKLFDELEGEIMKS